MRTIFLLIAACHGGSDRQAVGGQAGEEGTPPGPSYGGGALVLLGPEALAGAEGTLWPAGSPDCGYDVAGPGDVDGDGVPDITVTCTTDRRAVLLSGASSTAAPLATLLLASSNEVVAAVGDVDGDGRGDLGTVVPFLPHGTVDDEDSWGLVVPANRLAGTVPVADQGWVLLGEGRYNAGQTPYPAGDLDGDGLADVAVLASQGEFPATGYVEGARVRVFGGSALVGPGGTEIDAIYTSIPSPTELGPLRSAAGIGDVDGDGRDDLAIAPAPWEPLLGAGGSAVSASVYIVSGAAPQSTLADAPHLVGPVSTWQGVVNIVRVGDLDGDGRAEVAATLRRSASSEDVENRLIVVPGAAVPASGGLLTDDFVLTDLDVLELAACDLDGDGLPELVTNQGIWSGTDLLTPGGPPVADAPWSIRGITCLGDIDGDGTEDLALAHHPWSYDPT